MGRSGDSGNRGRGRNDRTRRGSSPSDSSRSAKPEFSGGSRKPRPGGKNFSGKPAEGSSDENRKPVNKPWSKNRISRKPKAGSSNPDETRLNKYLAHAGIASRREADELIRTGLVSVNGEVIVEMGYKVKPGDEVRYNGARVKPETLRYVLLNKPKDFISTVSDDRGRNTVMNLIGDACKERLYPVGRLDRNTTGVLLFTNDGDLAKKLTHPKHGVKKIYHVHLDQNLKSSDFEKIVNGVTLEDGPVTIDKLSYVEGATKKEVGLEIHIGRNRIVRRLFESLGYKVVKLDRVYFGGMTKKNIERGRWRFLSEKEVGMLKRLG